MATPDHRPRVNIIYPYFPHYRRPVMLALRDSEAFDYRFWADDREHEGIKMCASAPELPISPLRFIVKGKRMEISGLWPALSDPMAKAVIIAGNANMVSTWYAACAARALGKRVLFWAHGWLRPEPRMKSLLRRRYFGLAHHVLVYGERARLLAERAGFDPERITVIYNSLDVEASVRLRETLTAKPLDAIRAGLGLPSDRPVLVATARLTEVCRFDLLIDAAAQLQSRHQLRPFLVLIGEGPQSEALAAQARRRNVDLVLPGAIYDEARLAPYLYAADMAVSPGKVGLTAMHALVYGTPVATHGDFDYQMPEAEAVVDGVNGCLFTRDDANDLAKRLHLWLRGQRERDAIRAACIASIETTYTPANQRRLIDGALKRLLP